MRATIHLVSRADYWPFEIGVKRARADWTRRVATYGAPPAKLRAAASKLRRALDGGSLQRKEIEELLGKEMARGVGMELDLVRVPPAGTWERRRADLYAAAEDWLGPPPGGLTEEAGDRAARAALSRRLRAVDARRGGRLGGPAGRAGRAAPGADRDAPLPRRGRRRARRPAARAAAGPGHAGAGALPADLGRGAARPRPPQRASCPRSTGRGSSTRRCRSRSGPSSWTDRVAGTWKLDGGRIRTEPFEKLDRGDACASSTTRPSAWPTSTDRLRR